MLIPNMDIQVNNIYGFCFQKYYEIWKMSSAVSVDFPARKVLSKVSVNELNRMM